jgi:hypothetical protein
LQQWFALIQHVLHVEKPEELSEEEFEIHVSRVRWLFNKKLIYGVEFLPAEVDVEQPFDEEEYCKKFN